MSNSIKRIMSATAVAIALTWIAPQLASARSTWARGLSDTDVERLERACEAAGGTVERHFADGFGGMHCTLPGGSTIACWTDSSGRWTCVMDAKGPRATHSQATHTSTGTVSNDEPSTPSTATSTASPTQTSASTSTPGATRVVTSGARLTTLG